MTSVTRNSSVKVKEFIAPRVFIFQFYQYNLKLYKLILPYAKVHNYPSKRNNPKIVIVFRAKYGLFLDEINSLR